MMLRRSLYAAIGGLDESMDGGLWCLRDYTRRAERAGFRTVSVSSCRLTFGEPPQLGSLARREERSHAGEQAYRHRWGDEHHFCVALAGPEGEGALPQVLPAIITAARQGSRIILLVDKGVGRQLPGREDCLRHGGITVETLPALFARRALQKRLERLASVTPDLLRVVVAPGVAENRADLSVAAFIRMVDEIRQRYYRTEGAGDAEGS
jgi:hypothetical protein